ncbi:MAG: WecB/TagA/CpsF family glycosyltransferase [Acidobacteria bacterium]|nr:MAG: WecB/TagA/CpsF family glycosyltransferase [Acidobacteriota bacterium]
MGRSSIRWSKVSLRDSCSLHDVDVSGMTQSIIVGEETMSTHSISNSTPEYAKEELYRRFSRQGLRRQRLRRWMRGLSWILVVQLLSGAKRAMDVLLAISGLVILSPLFIVGLALMASRVIALERRPRVGRWCQTFDEYRFALPQNTWGRLLRLIRFHRLPTLFNILKGDMSLIGPRPVSPGTLSPRERAVRKRYDVRPGLVCLWWIRRRANIDYGTEIEADGEYVETQSVLGDLGIALRAIPAILYGEGVATAPDLVTILNIPIDNVTMAEAIEIIMNLLDSQHGHQICFVNADCANIAYRDEEYLRILRHADYVFADGIGLKLAGKLLGQEIKQNVNGTDLFPRLCESLSGTGKKVFLLGARPGVAERVRHWIAEHAPGVHVVGTQHGYFSPEEEASIIDRIADSGADLLLVALGAPRQDKWIHRHLDETGVKVAMGVGGLFDFYSGRIPRAPLWMREMGLEWLYRFIQEPKRMWKRYFVGNAIFLFRVIKERFINSRM